MKKIITMLGFALLLSTSLVADFLKVEMGAGVWLNTPSGQKTYASGIDIGTDVSLENENTNPYIWLYLKHPVPVLPNLRLEYVDVSTNGIANGTFEDFEALSSSTQFDVTQYDIIPYYNLLDNTAWVTLDLGLDIKILEATYSASNVTATDLSTTYSESGSVVLPLIYTRARVEIPSTNIGLEADAKFISYSSSTVYDVRVKIDYTLEIIPAIQPAIELGYRTQKYDIDEADLDGKFNLEFSGFYVGAMIRF